MTKVKYYVVVNKSLARTSENEQDGVTERGRRRDGEREIALRCKKRKWQKPPRTIFRKTSRSADRVDFNTRAYPTNRSCSENRASVSRSRTFGAVRCQTRDNTRLLPAKESERFFLSFFFSFLSFYDSDTKDATNSRDTWKRDLLQGPPDSWRS